MITITLWVFVCLFVCFCLFGFVFFLYRNWCRCTCFLIAIKQQIQKIQKSLCAFSNFIRKIISTDFKQSVDLAVFIFHKHGTHSTNKMRQRVRNAFFMMYENGSPWTRQSFLLAWNIILSRCVLDYCCHSPPKGRISNLRELKKEKPRT